MNTLITAPEGAQFLVKHPTQDPILCYAYSITNNSISIQEPFLTKQPYNPTKQPTPEPPITLFGSFSIQLVPIEP